MNPLFAWSHPTNNSDRLTGISIPHLAANAIVRWLLSWHVESEDSGCIGKSDDMRLLAKNRRFHSLAFAEPNRGHGHQIVAGGRSKMYHVRQENLPFLGSSHEFVGAEQGNTSVSVFLFHGKPGSGPGPHRHPYDEIQFIREGRGLWTSKAESSRTPRNCLMTGDAEVFAAKTVARIKSLL
jgi:hypothetical protein